MKVRGERSTRHGDVEWKRRRVPGNKNSSCKALQSGRGKANVFVKGRETTDKMER